jgi:hypothetical protein
MLIAVSMIHVHGSTRAPPRQPRTASAIVNAMSKHLVLLQFSTHGAKGALHLLALLSQRVTSNRMGGGYLLVTSFFRRHFCERQQQPTDLKPRYGFEPTWHVCDYNIPSKHRCDKPPKHLLKTSMGNDSYANQYTCNTLNTNVISHSSPVRKYHESSKCIPRQHHDDHCDGGLTFRFQHDACDKKCQLWVSPTYQISYTLKQATSRCEEHTTN